MKIREYCRDYLGAVALRFTMLLAVAGLLLMLAVAVLNTGSS